MIKLMEMPKWLENPNYYSPKCKISYYNSTQIKNKFWDSDKWKGPYIPAELKDKNWEPEEGKTYKCWWYWTNPSDPADPGEDILVYIEECEEDTKKNLAAKYISKILALLNKMSLNQLKNTLEQLSR